MARKIDMLESREVVLVVSWSCAGEERSIYLGRNLAERSEIPQPRCNAQEGGGIILALEEIPKPGKASQMAW